MVYRLGERPRHYMLHRLRSRLRLKVAYRLGERPRHYVFGRLQWRRQLEIGSLGILAVLIVGIVMAQLTSNSFSQEIGIIHRNRTSHKTSNIVDTASIHRSGSSLPAPKGTPVTKVTPIASGASNVLRQESCNVFPPEHVGLASAVSPELRKLSQYEQLCDGALATRTSFFVPTPSTVAAAGGDAEYVATMLEEYNKFGIAPLVYMEPDTDAGVDLSLTDYQNGAYNSALSAYFADLKADGITDSMMGIWVLIPEGNIPGWGSVDANTFAADVTITAQYQKQYFPNSQSAILLDSESYPSASSWSNGAYSSLVPYVQGIPKGLINSFGLEGFPWAPPANQQGPSEYNPQVYLRTDLAAAAARALGVSSIWLNTGTFHQMYTQNAAETVTMTPLQRQTILSEVVAQAQSLKQQGFTVAVHLFAQNKANTAEAIDWSYWQNQPGDLPDSAVLSTFVRDLSNANIPLWLFDTYDQ